MSTTLFTDYLDSVHSKTVIYFFFNVVLRYCTPKTGPACAGIKLGLRTEQRLGAGGAAVGAWGLGVPVGATEGAFGAFLTTHMELFGG